MEMCVGPLNLLECDTKKHKNFKHCFMTLFPDINVRKNSPHNDGLNYLNILKTVSGTAARERSLRVKINSV